MDLFVTERPFLPHAQYACSESVRYPGTLLFDRVKSCHHKCSRVVIAIGFALIFGLAQWIVSSQVHADDGLPVIHSAHLTQVEGVYRLDIQVGYGLTRAAEDALLHGVPLIFDIEINIKRVRRWWPNEKVADLDQKFRLEYHALSQQFLVKNLNTGVQDTFSDLSSALRQMGQLSDFPVIDASLLEPGQHYVLEIRTRLDIDRLPLPLLIQAYLTKDWVMKTDWYRMRLL